jgi:hypothetical protein
MRKIILADSILGLTFMNNQGHDKFGWGRRRLAGLVGAMVVGTVALTIGAVGFAGMTYAAEARIEMPSMPTPLMDDKGHLTRYVFANVILVLSDAAGVADVCVASALLHENMRDDLRARGLIVSAIEMHVEKARTELTQLAALVLPDGSLAGFEIEWTADSVRTEATVAGTPLAARCRALGVGGV